MTALPLIEPDWPAPGRVRVASTLRGGGVSTGAYESMNLGNHVGDGADSVAENRRRLRSQLALSAEPLWLHQTHGTRVAHAGDPHAVLPEADAAVAEGPGSVLAILTADCLPVMFCDSDGSRVGAAHAGWRGLAAGVLEATVAAMNCPPQRLMAWLGPAIGPRAFEVGEDVRSAFVSTAPECATAFTARRDRWTADLVALARHRLATIGVSAIYGGDWCTVSEPDRFFSYRRDGQCGRMATLVWIEAPGR